MWVIVNVVRIEELVVIEIFLGFCFCKLIIENIVVFNKEWMVFVEEDLKIV